MIGFRAWLLCLLVATLFGCAKKEDVIVKTSDGAPMGDEELDRDPLALLPGGAVGFAYFDAQQLFASEFGSRLLGLARARAPLPPSAGFEPSRDLSKIWLGIYSMQGVDVAAVATGNFDKQAIERAAESSEVSPLGGPVVKSTYSGRTLYTSQDIGFVVLTARTALLGNETGIRRALDRIEARRLRRQIPPYMSGLLDNPKAPIILGVDLRSQPFADAAREQFKFLQGLQSLRALGNFEPPGINFAATLGYASEQEASSGADSVRMLDETLKSYGWIMSLLGIAQPIRKLESRAQGKDAFVVLGVDGQVVAQLLDQLSSFLGVASQATPPAAGAR